MANPERDDFSPAPGVSTVPRPPVYGLPRFFYSGYILADVAALDCASAEYDVHSGRLECARRLENESPVDRTSVHGQRTYERGGFMRIIHSRLQTSRVVERSAFLATVAALTLGCGTGPDTGGTSSVAQAQGAEPASPAGTDVQASTVTDARIQAYLDSLYTAADVKHTFTTRFGEVVDCIDFQAYPSVKALAAAGVHVADEGPPVPPPSLPSMPAVDEGVAFHGQPDDSGSARACPAGTAPYLRETAARIQAAGGLDSYLWARSHQTSGRYHPPGGPMGPLCGSPTMNGFDWAIGNSAISNLGGTTVAAVYNPGLTVKSNCGGYQQKTCEHSLAQVWATTGTCEDTDGMGPNSCTVGASGNAVQSAELGWHVDPGVEPDLNTHLFTFSTQNGYDSYANGGGCYNTCSFVPASSPAYTPGQTISGIVGPFQGKAPLEYAFQVFNPGPSYPTQYQNWYVYVNGALIGYYPGSIFSGAMVTHATDFEVGGEIYSDYVNQPNDDVQMGSGVSSTGNGFDNVAYHRDIYTLNVGSGSGTICGNPLCSNGFCYGAMPLSGNSGLCGYQASNFYALSTTDATGGSSSGCWASYFYYGGGD